MLTHYNKTLRAASDFLHDVTLSSVWLAEYRVQSRHHWNFKVLEELKYVTTGFATVNPIFVLQAH